ncbi:MAG: hypothetical protein BIFFINMI_01752 [Phycisphaerae bacterium]|nr:hypothetical protein [Phycisphaerae bacterium]
MTAPDAPLATRPVIGLIDDLIFATRVSGTARQLGLAYQGLLGVTDLADRLVRGGACLLIVDLDFGKADPLAAIAAVRGDARLADLPIVAFGSHVQADRLAAALAAGATQALPRSAFTSRLPDLLTGLSGI